jgi:hypothetical protein
MMNTFIRLSHGLYDVIGLTKPQPENAAKVYLAFWGSALLFVALAAAVAIGIGLVIGRI